MDELEAKKAYLKLMKSCSEKYCQKVIDGKEPEPPKNLNELLHIARDKWLEIKRNTAKSSKFLIGYKKYLFMVKYLKLKDNI